MNGMNRFILRAIGMAALAAVFMHPATVWAGGHDTPAEWAPADAWFYLGCDDGEALVTAMKHTSEYKKLQDPKLKEAGEEASGKLSGALDSIAEKMGFGSIEELEEMGLGELKKFETYPRGPACLFVVANTEGKAKEEAPDMKVQFVGDMGKDFSKLSDIVKKLADKRVENGFKRETTDFRGVEIISLNMPEDKKAEKADDSEDSDTADDEDDSDDTDDDEEDDIFDDAEEDSAPPLVYAFDKKVIMIGTDVEVTKQTIRRLKSKESDCLAKSAGFAGVEAACSPLGQLITYVNLPQIFKEASRHDEDDKKMMSALGIDAWKPLVGTIRIGSPKGAEYSLQFNLPFGSIDKGLGKILAMKNRSVAPPAFIDSDTSVLFSVNIDPAAIFDEVLAITERIDPEQAKSMRSHLEVDVPAGEKTEKLHLRDDVLAKLDGPLTISVGLKKPYGSNSVRLLITLGQKKREAIEKLLNLAGPMLQKREMMGQQIYDVSIPGPFPMQGLALAITEKLMAVGSERSIAGVIRTGTGKAESLASEKEFKQLAKFVPEDAWLVGYMNNQKITEFLVKLLKSTEATPEGDENAEGDDADQFSQSLTGIGKMMLAGSIGDPSVLEASAKYEGQSVFVISTKGASLDIQAVAVAPAVSEDKKSEED